MAWRGRCTQRGQHMVRHRSGRLVLSVAAGVALASTRAAADPRPRPDVARLVDGRTASRLDAGRRITDGVYRFDQTFSGVPVVGGSVTVRFDRQGRVRWAQLPQGREIPSGFAVTPTVTAAQAVVAAGVDAGPRLVILLDPADQDPILAWELDGGPARAYVDAHSGALIRRENRVLRANKHRARVFDLNPLQSELEEVTFADLPEDATTLEDSDVRVVNCIDRRTCRDVRTTAGVRSLHYCELEPKATVGSDGSFLRIARPASDKSREDAFAEVQGYHHIKTANAFFAALDPLFDMPQLTLVVNQRLPDLSDPAAICTGLTANAKSRLQVEDNAYYWPDRPNSLGPLGLGHRVVMHQGSVIDWAYDGEVVYHEFTHAVMMHLTDMGFFFQDARGTSSQPGALHEAFADFFAGAVTNNGKLSMYAGQDEEGKPHPLPDLTRDDTCTETLSGEEHDESASMATALWAIRVSLRSQAKRDMFDRAMLRVVAGLRPQETFEGAVHLVLAELEVAAEDMIAGGGLSPSEVSLLRETVAKASEKFSARELPDCGGRLVRLRPGAVHRFMQLRGPNTFGVASFGGQFIPGTIQFGLNIPAETAALRFTAEDSFALDVTLKGGGLKEGPELQMLVKRGAPINWKWSLPSGEHDADFAVPLEVLEDEDGRIEAIAERPLPAGDYYIQIANRGEDWALDGVSLSFKDGNGEFVDKADGAGGAGEMRGGCATAHGGSSPLALSLALMMLFAMSTFFRPRKPF